MLLLDTSARRAEMVGIKLRQSTWSSTFSWVLGKGRREPTLPFGRRAGQALDRCRSGEIGEGEISADSPQMSHSVRNDKISQYRPRPAD
jgi:site-specific recombinase XerC